MPGGDGTGPFGTGPMGGGRGFCRAFSARGAGRRRGFFGAAPLNVVAEDDAASLRREADLLKARLAEVEKELAAKG